MSNALDALTEAFILTVVAIGALIVAMVWLPFLLIRGAAVLLGFADGPPPEGSLQSRWERWLGDGWVN